MVGFYGTHRTHKKRSWRRNAVFFFKKAKWQTLSFLDFFSGKAFLWCWFDPFFQTACGCLHQGRLVVRGQNREWGNGHRNSDKLLQQQENQNAEWYNRVGRTCYLLDSCRGKLGNLANHPQMEPGMYLTLKIYSNCSAEAGKEIKQTWFDSFKTRQASREFFSLRKEFQAGFRAPWSCKVFSPQLSRGELVWRMFFKVCHLETQLFTNTLQTEVKYRR